MFRIILFILAVVIVVGAMRGQLGDMPEGLALNTTLAAIASDPGSHEGQLITVSGKVGDRVSVMGYGGVYLVDGKGNSLIVLGVVSPPAPGATVTVTGKYVTAFALGDATASVVIVKLE